MVSPDLLFYDSLQPDDWANLYRRIIEIAKPMLERTAGDPSYRVKTIVVAGVNLHNVGMLSSMEFRFPDGNLINHSAPYWKRHANIVFTNSVGEMRACKGLKDFQKPEVVIVFSKARYHDITDADVIYDPVDDAENWLSKTSIESFQDATDVIN